MAEAPSKFDGATEEELAAHVAESRQRSKETDENWKDRVRQAEADLLAKIGVRKQAAPPAEAEQA